MAGLEEREVVDALEHDQPPSGSASAISCAPGDERVLGAGDDERRRRDVRQRRAVIHAAGDLLVEVAERVGVVARADQRIEHRRRVDAHRREEHALAPVELGQLRVAGIVARLAPPHRLHRVGEVGLARVRGDPLHPRLPDRVGEARRRAGEHELPHVVGVPGRPRHRDEPAVRMAEQVEPLDAEMAPNRLDVGGVVLEVVGRRIGRRIRSPRAARVEQEQRALGGQAREIAEVRRRAARPAGVAQERRAGARLVPGQRAAVARR